MKAPVKLPFWLLLCSLVLSLLPGCAHHARARVTRPETSYSLPLVSPGTQFGSLPPAVQRTIRAETGGTAIHDIWKRTDGSGLLVYIVWFENQAMWPSLYVSSDGSVLNADLSVAVGAPKDLTSVALGAGAGALTLGDLPPAVVKAIQNHAPTAEIAHISEEGAGSQFTYVVEFKDAVRPPLYVSPDGTVRNRVR